MRLEDLARVIKLAEERHRLVELRRKGTIKVSISTDIVIETFDSVVNNIVQPAVLSGLARRIAEIDRKLVALGVSID